MPSLKHNTLATMGLTWLAARCGSFRGVEEVQIGRGYVADGASLSVMYHSEFRRRCRGWGYEPKTITYSHEVGSPLALTERGDIPDYFASVFEAKATRADFLSTFGGRESRHVNRREPVAHLHWIVIERGVCYPEEVTGHWGLLVRSGRGLRELKPATYCPMDEVTLLRMAERLLWKPARGCSLILPCCPNCNGPVEDRRRHRWNAREPAHLMDDDPNDLVGEEMEGAAALEK